ncbi:MAG: hypothetical protein L0241_22335 [Planctomycetia bacterium]|nr:hypothetical protein [Planctomycetia bacterium]
MPSSSKGELTTVGGLSLLVAFLCFVTAIIFGCLDTVRLNPGSPTEAPNITSAGAACGFAVASGLCLIAAAIAESGAMKRAPKIDPPPSSGPA